MQKIEIMTLSRDKEKSVRKSGSGKSANDAAIRPFRFTSYGVRVEIISNRQNIVSQAEAVVRKSLLNNVKPYRGKRFDHRFELIHTDGGTYKLIQNGERLSYGRSRRKFFKYFDSIIRVAVGEYAVERVFLHAGVVAWRGRAILIPADSYKGKSTLVTELVRRGAEYYSDEFAILDADGLVSPFARPIAMRTTDGRFTPYEIELDSLGATTGIKPIPVGVILLTGYKPGARWRPEILTPGLGIIDLMPYTLSIRHAPEFSLSVLNKIARHAIIIRSLRGSAKNFSGILLDFVDKHLD